jgi:hypothetical protein
MQVRSIILTASFIIVFALPALAQSEPAALIDFNHGDARAAGTVTWHTEQVKTSDSHDDLAIRADVDIPGPRLKLTLVLRRNLDRSVPASHLIEMIFTAPPDFIDGSGLGNVFGVVLAPSEMSAGGHMLLGRSYKSDGQGRYLEELSLKPVEFCANLGAMNNDAWLAIYLNGAKRKPNVFSPAVSDQSLWFSKGETGQRVFDSVFAAWEMTAGSRNAARGPS